MITAPAQGSLLTACMQHWALAELCMERWSNSTTRLHVCVWWFVHSEHDRQFPQSCHWPVAFFIRGTGKRILGKFLGWNSDSGASIPGKPRAQLTLWKFKENILKACSAPDWLDVLCSLFWPQNVLQKRKNRRTQHWKLISTSYYVCYCWFQIKYKERAISYWWPTSKNPLHFGI